MRTKLKFLVPVLTLGLLATSCNAASIPLNYDPDDTDIDTPWEEYNVPLETLTFQEEDYDLVLEVGEKHDYVYTYTPSGATPSELKWSVSDPEVVKFNKDKANFSVEGLKTGKAVLTVDGGEKAGFDPIQLNVRVDIPLSSFTLDSSSLDLDLGESHQLVPTFEPNNTTQKELRYVVKEGENVISIDDFGKVTARSVGTAKIEVVSDLHDEKKQEVNVTVSDKYVYLTDFSVQVDKSRVEVGKTAQLSVNMLPANHSASLSDVRYISLTPEVLQVNEQTGEVKVLQVNEEGKGRVKAIVNQRDGDKDSLPLEIEVYEVKISSISLGEDSGKVIELGNKATISRQLSYTYEVDEVGATEPSYKDIIFSSSDDKVVTVTQEGLVEIAGPGEATITVMDTHSGKADSCSFKVTYLAEAITITTDRSSVLTDETFTVTATTNPTSLSHELTWNIEDSDNFEIEENGNKVKLSTHTPGEYTISASCDGIVSNELTVTVNKRPGVFMYNQYYIVGNRTYAGGESTTGESWDDADKAFLLEEFIRVIPETDEIYYEEFGRLALSAGDEFKVRRGDEYYQNIIDDVKHYDEKDAIPDYINVIGDYQNFVVQEDGVYDIYFKIYHRGEENEWHQMYIGFAPVFSVSTTELTISDSGEGKFKVSNWSEYGILSVTIDDDTIATIEEVNSSGFVFIEGLKEGTTTIRVNDGVNDELTVTLHVAHIEYKYIYLNANEMFDQDGVMWAHAWDNNGGEDYLFENVVDEFSVYYVKINKAYDHIIFTRNEPSSTGPWDKTWNQTADLEIPEGKDLWTMEGYDNGVPYGEWSTYQAPSKDFYVTPESLTIQVGDCGLITPHNNIGTVTYVSVDSSIASVSNGIVTGIAIGKTQIVVSDGLDSKYVDVEVVEEVPDFEDDVYYLVGNRNYSSGTSVTGSSWGDVTQALPMTNDIGPDAEKGVDHQYKVTVNLTIGDEFKFRLGQDYLDNVYAEPYGAIPTGVDRGATSYTDNFVVSQSGRYDILLKHGTDGGYSVYICETPSMSVDKENLSLGVSSTGTINVYNASGELKVESKDTSVATVSLSGSVITVTAVAVGSATVELKDDEKTINVTITVTQESPTTQTIVVYTNSTYQSDGAWFTVWAWQSGHDGHLYTATTGGYEDEGNWTFEVPIECDNMIVIRMKGGVVITNYDIFPDDDQKYNQTGNKSIQAGKTFTITSWFDGEWN